MTYREAYLEAEWVLRILGDVRSAGHGAATEWARCWKEVVQDDAYNADYASY